MFWKRTARRLARSTQEDAEQDVQVHNVVNNMSSRTALEVDLAHCETTLRISHDHSGYAGDHDEPSPPNSVERENDRQHSSHRRLSHQQTDESGHVILVGPRYKSARIGRRLRRSGG